MKKIMLMILFNSLFTNAFADTAKIVNKSDEAMNVTYMKCVYHRNASGDYCEGGVSIVAPANGYAAVEVPPFRPEQAVVVHITHVSNSHTTENFSNHSCYADFSKAASLYYFDQMIFCRS